MLDHLLDTLLGNSIEIELLDRRIKVSKYLLTNAQFVELANACGFDNCTSHTYRHLNTFNPENPVTFCPKEKWHVRNEASDHPVVGLTLFGALMICRACGGELLTADCWESIAKYGHTEGVDFPWGNAPPSPELANYGHHRHSTTSVGVFPPTPAGLYDLAGNAEEWVIEHPDMIFDSDNLPPRGCVKGGGWNKPSSWMKIGAVRYRASHLGGMSTGMRLAWYIGTQKP